MEVDRSTYLLWKQFSMPTQNGTRHAISVSFEDGKKLLSAYTLMVDLIVMQLWTLAVLIAISAHIRKPHSPNIGAASAAIWNSQGSPFTVMKLMAKYLLLVKKWRDWLYILVWMLAAAVLIAATYVLSIGVPRFLLLGNAAPVNPKSIYIPEVRDDATVKVEYEAFTLKVPASLRAVGNVNSATLQKVSVHTSPVSLGVNGSIKQVNYSYEITAAEFGLQHAAGLILSVEGSCITEYGWLNNSASGLDENNMWIDAYNFANSKNQTLAIQLSLYDGRPPIAYFYLGPEEKTKTNTSFVIAVSSAGRYSFSEGTDPLYATNKTSDGNLTDQGITDTVMTNRPLLSCWENDVWSYHGQKGAVSQLAGFSNLNMPYGLAKNFNRSLGIPMIVYLGTMLGSQALQSASTTLGQTIDASSASMESDLHHLVAASYIAAKSVLTDTTTINRNLTTLDNAAIDPQTSDLFAGAADFIVTSSDIATISIKVLITIPFILIFLLFLITIITQSSASWNKAQALQATVLYSCLDERSVGRTKGTWNRSSYVAYYNADAENQASLKPEFERETGLYWTRGKYDDEYVFVLFFFSLRFFFSKCEPLVLNYMAHFLTETEKVGTPGHLARLKLS